METLSNGEMSSESVSSKTQDDTIDSEDKTTEKSQKDCIEPEVGKKELCPETMQKDTHDKQVEKTLVDSVECENKDDTKESKIMLEKDSPEPMDVDDSVSENESKFDTKEKQSKDCLILSSDKKTQLPHGGDKGQENGLVEDKTESVSKSLNDSIALNDNVPISTSDCPNKEITSVTKDVTCSKGTIIEINNKEVEGKSNNHLMSGGSIISTSDNSQKKMKTSKINDIAKKLLGENSSKLSNLQQITISSVNTSSQKSTLVEDTNVKNMNLLNSSKSVDETISNELDSLKKLNEHLKSIGIESKAIPVNNHSPKTNSISEKPSLSSITVTEVTDLQSADKENKGDTPLLQERLKEESTESLVFAELSNEEIGFPEAFTGLVKVGKYIAVKGDFTLRSSEALLESTSHVSPYLLKEPDVFPPREKESKNEPIDFFHSVAGEVLIGIGISRVNEWFHRDMVRIKKRQIKKGGKTPELEKELTSHENMYIEAKKANSIYTFKLNSCQTCGFSTESSIVMEGHLLIPHVTQKREYQCNFCDEIIKDPKLILEHMKNAHRKIGRVQPPTSYFECPYCTFENNSKVKLNNHLVKCQRFFNHQFNQAPTKDFEFPALTPKPITVAVVKAYEKSLGSMNRGRGRPKKEILDPMFVNHFNNSLSPLSPNQIPGFRSSSNSPLADSLSLQNQIMTSLQMSNMNLRPAHSNTVGHPSNISMASAQQYLQLLNSSGQGLPMIGNSPLLSGSRLPYPNLNASLGKNNSIFTSMLNTPPRPNSQDASGVTITPLPKLQGPYPVPMAKPSSSPGTSNLQAGLVVCEICDGYIKDLEQLRTHMQLIHKVKIHPKMLVSRPPLNCQKCQWRFFTDQGLERHLLGAHGLVTSNMQELANKGKDAGCCTICGRVYASKLVSHMNQVHKTTLKPAHLSYKCTVCSATFNLYRLFENHVYLVHSGAAKRAATDGRSSPSKKLKSSSDIASSASKNDEKDLSDENTRKCTKCGSTSQSDICEKCLKSEKTSNGSIKKKSIDVELQNNKAIEQATA